MKTKKQKAAPRMPQSILWQNILFWVCVKLNPIGTFNPKLIGEDGYPHPDAPNHNIEKVIKHLSEKDILSLWCSELEEALSKRGINGDVPRTALASGSILLVEDLVQEIWSSVQ